MSDDPQDWRAVLEGRREWAVVCGDCLGLLADLPRDAAVVTDPPYGMRWNTDSTRFAGGDRGHRRAFEGRNDWGAVANDAAPFDPTPWLSFRRVVLFGSNHYAARLPIGTTLVWVKRAPHLYGSFLSDAEVAWMKGGHGVYCYEKQFPPPSRMSESGQGECVHPCQKPIGLLQWCMDRAKVPPGGLVLDPYAGSGSCGVAAIQSGRRYIGIEIEPRYHAVAVDRLTRAAMYRQPMLVGMDG